MDWNKSAHISELLTALFDAQDHALAVDALTLRATTSLAQPRAVRDRERDLVLQIAGSDDQAGDFLPAQDDRHGAWQANRLHLGHQLGMIERDVEEELQAGDGGI
jgi:hypothetical protein